MGIELSHDLSQLFSDKDCIVSYAVKPSSLGADISINESTAHYFLNNMSSTTETDIFSFDAFAHSGKIATSSITVRVTPYDPLFKHQWSITNTGQSSFASEGGVEDMDTQVDEVHRQNILGSNIVVSVVDDGIEIAHEDLNTTEGSWDFVDEDEDPSLATIVGDSACLATQSQGSHGLSCAGVIASKGWNQVGIRGIAPEAKLKGYNPLCSELTSDFVKSWGTQGSEDTGDLARNSEADIYNNSWGYDAMDETKEEEDSLLKAQILERTENGRNNKGSIFVKAAGNGRYDFIDMTSTEDEPKETLTLWANQLNVSYQNSSFEGSSNNIRIFNVAASNADGKYASYSSAGSNILITAPGGEYGDDEPAIITTDSSSCEKGYVGGRPDNEAINEFQEKDPEHPENNNCNYTSTFNGSSAAGPHLSGVIALMLSARPELSWREVKDILIQTASKIDPDVPAIISPSSLCNSFDQTNACTSSTNIVAGVTLVDSWSKNAADIFFHTSYGFGQVNAKEAVDLAKEYTLGSLGSLVENAAIAKTDEAVIPDYDGTGISQTITVSDDLIIEGLYLGLNILHDSIGELHIELLSPSGTKSIVHTLGQQQGDEDGIGASDPTDTSSYFELLNYAFYGESSAGTWTLSIKDLAEGTSIISDSGNTPKLQKWTLRFSGREAKTINTLHKG